MNPNKAKMITTVIRLVPTTLTKKKLQLKQNNLFKSS